MTEKKFNQQSIFDEVQLDVAANHKSKKFSLLAFFALLFFSTGFQLLISYRIQNRLFRLQIPVLGKLVAKILNIVTTWMTACHIDPLAKIEGGIFLPHATGIVISQSAIIKSGATIYQGVTIGISDVAKRGAAPYIGHDVIIYAGAQVIGDIKIGNDVKIGANAVVLKSLPNNSTAVGVPARILNNAA
jgi:serine O-acetyltransferase